MSEIAKFRAFSQENLVEVLKQLISFLTSRAKGRELVGILRDLLRCLTLARADLEVPQTLAQDLY